MAAGTKVVLTFRSAKGDTWTETYFNGTKATALAAATLTPAALAARLSFLNPFFTLYSAKGYLLAGNYPAYPVDIELKGTRSVSPDNSPDVAGTSMAWNCFDNAARVQRRKFRGLTDADVVISPTGIQSAGGGIGVAVNAFLQEMGRDGYGWQPRLKRDDALVDTRYNPITSADPTVQAGYTTLNFQNPRPAGMVVGSRVSISQCDEKRLPGINGYWTVLAIDTSSILIHYQMAVPTVIQNTGGRIRLYQAAAFAAFSQSIPATFQGFVSRRTRNAFTRSRGGRRVRNLRTLV